MRQTIRYHPLHPLPGGRGAPPHADIATNWEESMDLALDHDADECVFFDLETQSLADVKAVGGRKYAADPSTRVLTADFLIDGVHHAWVPDHLWDGAIPRFDVAAATPAECRSPVVVHQ